tara:strand:- start:131 stop:790 length:660 start_codon:yes stop_codon:yes gene_type:complete
MIIYKQNKIVIRKKKKGEYELQVPWESDQKKFWLHFPFPLLNIISSNIIHQSDKIFKIHTKSIQRLTQFLARQKGRLSYEDCIHLLYDVGNQLRALEGFHMAIPYIDIHDIIVVNDRHFFYMDAEKALPIESGQITIASPYKQSPFFSPEFKNISGIPTYISAMSGFYSLGALVCYCMTNTYDSENYQTLLQTIYATKLYWALERLLQIDPNDRCYLII